jgi:hypothetical protein
MYGAIWANFNCSDSSPWPKPLVLDQGAQVLTGHTIALSQHRPCW